MNDEDNSSHEQNVATKHVHRGVLKGPPPPAGGKNWRAPPETLKNCEKKTIEIDEKCEF